MLRRHNWLKPENRSSMSASNGTWNTYFGWKSPNPAPDSLRRQPADCSAWVMSSATCDDSSAGTSPGRRTPPSAMAALTVAAFQRRATTGGPIFTEHALRARRCSSRGTVIAEQEYWDQSMTGPSGRYARDRLVRGTRGHRTRAPPTSDSPSNQPRLSASQSFLTFAQAGVCRNEPLASSTTATCCSTLIGRTASAGRWSGGTAASLGGNRIRKPGGASRQKGPLRAERPLQR